MGCSICYKIQYEGLPTKPETQLDKESKGCDEQWKRKNNGLHPDGNKECGLC
jgi:hypothetical protein